MSTSKGIITECRSTDAFPKMCIRDSGYLIDGHLSDVQQEFCMLFGFTLQVADDLQDVVEDDQHHHHTLATICNKACLLYTSRT